MYGFCWAWWVKSWLVTFCRVEMIMKSMNHQKQLAIQVSYWDMLSFISVCFVLEIFFMTSKIVYVVTVTSPEDTMAKCKALFMSWNTIHLKNTVSRVWFFFGENLQLLIVYITRNERSVFEYYRYCMFWILIHLIKYFVIIQNKNWFLKY